MIVVAVEGEYPDRGTFVAAAYAPTSDTWRQVAAPDPLRTTGTLAAPDTPPEIHTEPGPSVSGADGRVFMVVGGKLLSRHADDESWIEAHASDERLQRLREGSGPVVHDGVVYQGLTNRDAARHGLATMDGSTGAILALDDLDLPGDLAGNIVAPLHPIFDGDELLLLGVESIGSQPRKATVLEHSDTGWEIVAQTDDEDFAGVATGGYKALIPGDDAVYSLHFNYEAGVFVPSERTFKILDLEQLNRCALGDATVWTGDALIGWNGGHCRDEPVHQFQPEANRAVMLTPR